VSGQDTCRAWKKSRCTVVTVYIYTVWCTKDLLRSDYLSVMDLEKVGAKKSLVHVDCPVMELTGVGQTTRARAQLESERRSCGNTTEEVTGVNVKLTKRLMKNAHFRET